MIADAKRLASRDFSCQRKKLNSPSPSTSKNQ
jgi:hypothetical protein